MPQGRKTFLLLTLLTSIVIFQLPGFRSVKNYKTENARVELHEEQHKSTVKELHATNASGISKNKVRISHNSILLRSFFSHTYEQFDFGGLFSE